MQRSIGFFQYRAVAIQAEEQTFLEFWTEVLPCGILRKGSAWSGELFCLRHCVITVTNFRFLQADVRFELCKKLPKLASLFLSQGKSAKVFRRVQRPEAQQRQSYSCRMASRTGTIRASADESQPYALLARSSNCADMGRHEQR
jgi:hypothetical protein